ncbi:nitrogen fixation protein FixH [Stappia sp. 22II-S9-Z10]|nr:nitrogen fixation protein FixH [Stappia sp. 22II-S9-Z10]
MTLSATPRKAAREFTGRHMLLIMVAFFGVVITVNITMAVYANRTFNGLVAKNGYVASIDYAAQGRARDQAAALGWHIAIADRAGHVGVDLTGENGAPLVAVVSATIEPLLGGDPQPIGFTAVGAGRYRSVEALPEGSWVVRATIARDGESVGWRHVIDRHPRAVQDRS